MIRLNIKNVLFLTLFSCSLVLNVFAEQSLFLPRIEEDLVPFFITNSHPIKKDLDSIFKKKRATLNKKALKKAGFKILKRKFDSGFIVASHPSFPSYIFKLFMDEPCNHHVEEWRNFRNRIAGAISIQNCIERRGWEDFFSVPKKWIYLLPEGPGVPEGYQKRKYMLVAEALPLTSSGENYGIWNSPIITKDILNRVYELLEEEGLWDSTIPSNLFFTVSGKIAIVDTEYHHMWPVRYSKLLRYLTPQAAAYWKKLTEHSKGAE